MKNTLRLLFVVLFIFTACQPKTATTPFDKVAAKEGLTKTLDTMYAAFSARDSITFMSLMTEDGLFCGTSPKDFWDKATYAKLMTALLADTSLSTKISVDKREIRFDKTGNSAFVIDQFFFAWNNKIPVRHTIHFVKNGNAWKCDFLSTSFIPKDEDIDKIYNAVK